MASAPRLALGLFLSLLGVCVEGNCPTFFTASGWNISCSPECLGPSTSGQDPVFGTEFYNASSDVCLSALHAGVVGLQGGPVQFRKAGASPINGTIANRVVSRSGDPAVAYTFVRENRPAQFAEEDLTEKVLVHNSYFQDLLHLTCVAERPDVNLDKNNIARLEYGQYHGSADVFQARYTQNGEQCIFPFEYSGRSYWGCADGNWCYTHTSWDDCSYAKGPWRVHLNKPKSKNLHVFRCLGTSPAADILAAIQAHGQTYTAARPTFRASRGDRLEVQLETDPQAAAVVFFKKFPDDWRYTSNNVATTSLPLTVDPVSPAHNGVYLLGNSITRRWGKDTESEIGSNGAYFHLAVRDCEAGRYGWNCESWCPDCENGGICHPRTGACICPPGYYGPTCQSACSPDKFGSACQLECSKATLGFDLPREGSCHHLTICLPDPYGCSCAAGYTGPLCDRPCRKGTYGAGCTLSCENFCKAGVCDPTTGKCSHGCKVGVPCSVDGIVLDVPRLARPPGIAGVTNTTALVTFSSWDRDTDDGSPDFPVTGYRVLYREVQGTEWHVVDSLGSHSGDRSVQLSDLRPGFEYKVRVLVMTESGLVDGSTNQRVQSADFITNCSDPSIAEVETTRVTNSSASLSWSLSVQVHPRCEVTYVLKFRKKSGGTKIRRETSATSFTVTGLDSDTEYKLTIGFLSGIAREPKFLEEIWPFRTLMSPPLAPILSLEVTAIREIKVKLDLPRQSSRANIYDVSYKLLKYEACNDRVSQAASHEHHTAAEIYLKDLENHATYEVCVLAKNGGGSGPAACSLKTTLPTAPEVELRGACQYFPSSRYYSCSLIGNCEQYNGPNARAELIVETFLECENKPYKSEYSQALSRDYARFYFNNDLLKGATYNATFAVKNDAGTGPELTSSFTTSPDRPPRVKDLVGVALSSREVRLLWNDPCPPKGRITSFQYRGRSTWISMAAVPCSAQPLYDRCVKVENLAANTNYTFEVVAYSDRVRGYVASVDVSTVEAKPGPPSAMSTIPGDSFIEVSLQFPVAPGGLLLNFSISLADGQHACSDKIPRESTGPVACKLQNLERGKIYIARSYFCNSAGCGPSLSQDVATRPAPPTFAGSLGVLAKTDSNITLSLPSIQTEGDGESSLIVLVQHIPKEEISNYRKESFVKLYATLMKRHRANDEYEMPGPEKPRDAEAEELQGSPPRQKRRVGADCKNRDEEYIAGIVDNEQQKEFVIGGEDSGYDNCPLTPDDFYMIGAVARVNLLGHQSYAETSLGAPVKAAFDGASPLAVALPLLLLLALLVLVLGIVYLKKFRKPKDTLEFQDSNARILDDRVNHSEGNSNLIPVQQSVALMPMQPVPQQYPPTPGPTVPDREPPSPPLQDNIYENVGTVTANRIARVELEAYLNKVIGTQDAAEDFKKIPATMDKSMAYGEQLQVKKKNRFRNNLPFDETRVKLSVINNDPFSDYINANHVYGFGGSLRYIASQGPKDANVNTIGDFWRMIYEQQMDIIIMVANFIEGGRVKVGEYFQRGATLEFDGYVVSAVKSEQHPHYIVSTIQVWKGDICHVVTHYHYTRWPDHGVPSEAQTLAAMMRDILITHTQGGAVVHCSAGIGRTGTVLLVLLMHEMLTISGDVDPVQVLRRLRECRARLVENQAQYNFGLEVFDEILYGAQTMTAPSMLATALPRLLQDSHILYARAKALPTGLTFSIGSQASVANLNRSEDLLPADSRSIFLNTGDGQISSQYINAVRINGLDKPDTLIVTEHPLQSSMLKFWHLVIEKNCLSVILLNSFDVSEQTEFPALIPEEDSYFTIGSYSIQTQHFQEYEAVVQYSLSITTEKNTEHKVVVYQVRDWPRTSDVPNNPDVLLTVADLVLSGPANDGPMLLCCADGATACGLMAGVILTVERLQTYQEVDVYRTVVRLLRCRPQFFTSVVQFDSLYQAALSYIENYDTYANFSG